MKSTPDQHDPDWPRYPETILKFAVEPPVSIDLRAMPTASSLSGLKRIGLSEPFAVMTAFDPRGENLTREENDQLSHKLEARLCEMGRDFIRVDACSPDGAHCECSVAVRMPQQEAITLAAEFEQVALFWFDGGQFWILGAIVKTDPVMLPRSS
ncbi:MAG: DUF3293 domain-containing protein [Gemmatimonadota bacterium]|nr:DUF3293 domain-containing protein [Gemmatimonadota bacterium]